MDYILFIQAKVDVTANPEEVRDHKYVTHDELKRMMDPSAGLLWSPWFRIIAERFLVDWWSDLSATLTTDKHVDLKEIHRFDCTAEHMGGAGNAGPWLDTEASGPEGDAWLAAVVQNGKVPIDAEEMKPRLVKAEDSNTYSLGPRVGHQTKKPRTEAQ
jgi:hypothetical protein